MDKALLKKMQHYSERAASNPTDLRIAPDEHLVQEFLSSSVDHQSIQNVYAAGDVLADIKRKYNNDVLNDKTPEMLISELKGKFDDNQVSALFNDCKDTVLNSILGPFGLTKDLIQDNDGGNVTTIHNARKGIYASEKDQYNRTDYKYNDSLKNYKLQKCEADGTIIDEYTGSKINCKDADVDHVIGLKNYNDDGGYMQTEQEKSKFARDTNNHAVTSSSINRSKSSQNIKEFESNTVKKQSSPNKKRYEIDDRRVDAKLKKAQQAEDAALPSSREKAKYYVSNSVTSGVSVGLKYGFQQVLGLVLRDITIGLFNAVRDIYTSKAFTSIDSLFEKLKSKVSEIIQSVKEKWKTYLQAFENGVLTGFLSNVATTFINLFCTTKAKLIKMLREGAMSLYQACKLLITRPNDISMPEAAHEASKLIATGILTALGVALNEALSVLLKPLGVLGDIVSGVLTGLFIGLTTTIVVYIIDKIDIWGVNEQKKQQYIASSINQMRQSVHDETEEYKKILND